MLFEDDKLENEEITSEEENEEEQVSSAGSSDIVEAGIAAGLRNTGWFHDCLCSSTFMGLSNLKTLF